MKHDPKMPDQADCAECKNMLPGEIRCKHCMNLLLAEVCIKREKEVTSLEARVMELEKKHSGLESLLKDICAEWNEDCNETCDSLAHDRDCKSVNIAEAKKAMKNKLAETQAALDVARGATKEVFECAKDCYRKDNEEFMRAPAGNPNGCWGAPSRHLQTFDWVMTTITNAFSNSAILKRQKELDAMEKIIYLCQTHKILEPECGCDICNALSELDAVRGGKG